MLEQYVATSSRRGDADSKANTRFPDEIMLAVGMEVMVTLNVETELDIANGARGTVVSIVLDPNEPPFDPTAPVVTLSRVPLCVLIKMSRRTRAITLPGPGPDVLPIVQKTVRRLQLPMTPMYAFTDYRSQGQTISAAIVDIAPPPSGKKLTLYNIYVALSWSSGRDTIRLLRGFDEKLLMERLDFDLLAEGHRLDQLDATTARW
ncbi:hypothetical protein FRC12_022775 [Ceratobasidium sp. 428]|nr:hypothetical protein FRC12_022775 [Ceratobasidium sp. 428]